VLKRLALTAIAGTMLALGTTAGPRLPIVRRRGPIGQEAWLTVLMLKSGTRRVGIEVRLK